MEDTGAMATSKKSAGKRTNAPVSTARDSEDITNDQEKATLPANERGGAKIEHESADIADDGGLVMSDESGIPERDPKADGESPDPQMDGEDEAGAPEDPNEDAVTSAQLVHSFDVRPDFYAMDEPALDRFFRVYTAHKRQEGFTVRGPEVREFTRDASGAVFPANVSGKQSTKREKSGEEVTIFEGFYEWQGKENTAHVVTIRTPNLDRLGALRDAAQEAMHRRGNV